MKPATLKVSIAAAALGLSLLPSLGWSTRAYPPPITGTVTASPSNGTIEVDHRSYHIQANSAAAKALGSIFVGENVDVIVDGPPGGAVEVIIITPHHG
jgi:hypothetical protein